MAKFLRPLSARRNHSEEACDFIIDILDIDKAKNGPSIRKVPIHASLIDRTSLTTFAGCVKAAKSSCFRS